MATTTKTQTTILTKQHHQKGKHSTNRPLCKLQVSSQGSGDNPRLSLFPVHCTDHGFLHLLQMLSVINKKKKGWQISVIM